MKKIYLSFITCGVLGIVLLNSNAGGPASNGNRATGAPGDGSSTCMTCHNNTGTFGDVTIDLAFVDKNGNPKSEYVPDSTYDIKVTVNNEMGTPAGYGFQMICLDSSEANHDGWSSPSANAQLTTSAGRNYVEHDGISSSNEFTVKWTAPAAGAMYVTFYVGGNAVNEASGNSGDRAGLNEFTFSEVEGEEPNSVVELSQKGLSVYPNPTAGLVNIVNDKNASIHVFNTEGKLVQLETTNTNQIDLTNQPTGFYMLINPETGKSQKVFKL